MTSRQSNVRLTVQDKPIVGYRVCQVCQKDYPIFRGQGNSKHCLKCADTVKREQNKECANRIREFNTRAVREPSCNVVGALSIQQMSPEHMVAMFGQWSKGSVDIV